eukprot:COSAG01_NODE_2109_length_8408_cov_33.352870_6_plen_54_part_00
MSPYWGAVAGERRAQRINRGASGPTGWLRPLCRDWMERLRGGRGRLTVVSVCG